MSIAQRFFYRKSVKEYSAFEVGMASLYISCKIEENTRSPIAISIVFIRLLQRRKGLAVVNPEVNPKRVDLWVAKIIEVENIILIELGFKLYALLQHPHSFILYYIAFLGNDSELAQRSWNYLNDCMMSDICTRYSPATIACSSILISARQLKKSLPSSPPWWKLFCEDGSILKSCCTYIMSIYNETSIEWVHPIKTTAIEYDIDSMTDLLPTNMSPENISPNSNNSPPNKSPSNISNDKIIRSTESNNHTKFSSNSPYNRNSPRDDRHKNKHSDRSDKPERRRNHRSRSRSRNKDRISNSAKLKDPSAERDYINIPLDKYNGRYNEGYDENYKYDGKYRDRSRSRERPRNKLKDQEKRVDRNNRIDRHKDRDRERTKYRDKERSFEERDAERSNDKDIDREPHEREYEREKGHEYKSSKLHHRSSTHQYSESDNTTTSTTRTRHFDVE